MNDMLKADHAPAPVHERIIGYRYSATGVWGCEFYCGDDELCSVYSMVVPSALVRISGRGMVWESPFDRDSTIVPGLTRDVYDGTTGEKAAVLTYMAPGRYTIGDQVLVLCDDDGCSFYSDGEMVARTVRCRGGEVRLPAGLMQYSSDYEPRYDVSFMKETGDRLKLLICAFPLLRFGL